MVRGTSRLLALATMLLFLGAMVPGITGQQGSPPIAVYGTVYDSDGSTPLAGAVVTGTNTVSGETYTNTTEGDGKYTFAFYDYENGDGLALRVEHGAREAYRNATLDYSQATLIKIDFTLPSQATNGGGEEDWTEYLYEMVAAIVIIIILLFVLFWWWHEEEEGGDEGDEDDPPKYEKGRKRSR